MNGWVKWMLWMVKVGGELEPNRSQFMRSIGLFFLPVQ